VQRARVDVDVVADAEHRVAEGLLRKTRARGGPGGGVDRLLVPSGAGGLELGEEALGHGWGVSVGARRLTVPGARGAVSPSGTAAHKAEVAGDTA
jgi:hypothetical protein